jgi:hypothetical protein
VTSTIEINNILTYKHNFNPPFSTDGVFYLKLIYYFCTMVGLILFLLIIIVSAFIRKVNKDKDHPFNKFLNDREE